MKRIYKRPEIEISLYLVNEAFASCVTVIDLGPSTAVYSTTCSSYKGNEDLGDGGDGEWVSIASTTGVNFYEDESYGSDCDCYYTSGDGTLLMS